MAISSGGGGNDTPMSDINTTPLVDVMLVLLIVFLIAIPVAIQTVKMELPVVQFEPTKAKRENVLLSVTTTDVNGNFRFDVTDVPPDLIFIAGSSFDGLNFSSGANQLDRSNPMLEMPVTVYDLSLIHISEPTRPY